jgi:hypothetical protein
MQLARLVPVEVAWALGGKAEPIAWPKQTTAFHRVEKAAVERQPEHAVQVIEQRGGAEPARRAKTDRIRMPAQPDLDRGAQGGQQQRA